MRLLVIEDEPGLQRALRRGLVEEGFSVDVSGDGQDGVARARATDYDAIVLDLLIPKRSGREVLDDLRRSGRTTPVLILTARDEEAQKTSGLNAGADDYMTKPFSVAELVARLRALIRRAHGSATAVIRVADLEIDTAARRVARAGRTIDLRAKEYALLELLALRRGRIVSHREIYDHIYDDANDTLSNTVDVHVCRLRRRMDRGFGARLIHTVRGRGYVLDSR